MMVKIKKLDYFGRGVSRDKEKVLFVEGSLPEEVVDIEIIKENKKFNEGKVVKVIEASPMRIESPCPYSKECGGCCLLHADSTLEDEYKVSKVKELIERVAGLDRNLVGDILTLKKLHYRNKAVFHVKNRRLGFYKEKSNDIVEIDSCRLIREEINQLIPVFKDLVKNEKNDIEEIMVRVGNNNTKDKVMVSIKGEVRDLEKLKELVDVLILNNRKVTEESQLLINIGPNRYYVSDKSFFQVNDTVVIKLYDEVLNFCKSHSIGKVLDLYCGTGTIGIYIADVVGEVLGIDSASSSIKNAKENKKLNQKNNVRFICSKVEDYIDRVKGNYDLVIVDPPRAGLDNKTISHLLKIKSKNIIYISCDPSTMARDLKKLSVDYEVSGIKLFNMFPKTYHCESIAVLERK